MQITPRGHPDQERGRTDHMRARAVGPPVSTASRSIKPTFRHTKRVEPYTRPRVWSTDFFYHLFNAALVV